MDLFKKFKGLGKKQEQQRTTEHVMSVNEIMDNMKNNPVTNAIVIDTAKELLQEQKEKEFQEKFGESYNRIKTCLFKSEHGLQSPDKQLNVLLEQYQKYSDSITPADMLLLPYLLERETMGLRISNKEILQLQNIRQNAKTFKNLMKLSTTSIQSQILIGLFGSLKTEEEQDKKFKEFTTTHQGLVQLALENQNKTL